MDVIMLHDVKVYLVSCFRWSILYLASNNTLRFFLSVLQDKCELNIQITVVILARFLFRPVIFNRGLKLKVQH